jgi:hypothetical protein
MTKVSQPIELTNYERFQLERYGNILPTVANTPDADLFESGLEELERLAAWTESQLEIKEVYHD